MPYKHLIFRLGLITSLAVGPGAAFAVDCWLATKQQSPGFGSYSKNTILDIERTLRSDAGLNGLPGVRLQPHIFIDKIAMHKGAPAGAEVYVAAHGEKAWLKNCGLAKWADTARALEIFVHVNNLSSVFEPAEMTDGLPGLDAFYMPVEIGKNGNSSIFKGYKLILTRNNLPPFIPITAKEYIDAWRGKLEGQSKSDSQKGASKSDDSEWESYIASVQKTDPKAAQELRKSLAESRQFASNADQSSAEEIVEFRKFVQKFPSSKLSAPVYVSAEITERHQYAFETRPQEGARQLVKVNPALWQGVDRGAISTLVLDVAMKSLDTFEKDLNPLEAAAANWLQTTNLSAYQAHLSAK